MNSALTGMLDAYQPKNPSDYQKAAREVVQELALLACGAGAFSRTPLFTAALLCEYFMDSAVSRRILISRFWLDALPSGLTVTCQPFLLN